MSKPLIPRSSRYDYHPITRRRDFSWPGGKRLAFCLTTNMEVFAFGTGSAGTRVLYMESIFDREAALDVLKTVLNDRVASQAFFGETSRLERDLMANGATVELMRRFGHLGNQPRSLVE